MLCKIADLIAEVPEAGDLVPRCREYLFNGNASADIVIRTEQFNMDSRPLLSEQDRIYMQSGFRFNGNLLKYNGMMLHASAVVNEGKAYLFSGPCGMGKSTHTKLWKQAFGNEVQIINDDKPALRCLNGVWYAYGTPWCGKDGINVNMKAPLAGICFLKQAPENKIRRLGELEAAKKIISQTIHKFWKADMLDLMLTNVDNLVCNIPIFELENCPEIEAAELSYKTMRRAAEEIGL